MRQKFHKATPKSSNRIDPLFHSKADYESYQKLCYDRFWKEKFEWEAKHSSAGANQN